MPIVLKSGNLNLLEPCGPVEACNGIAVLLYPHTHEEKLSQFTTCKIVSPLQMCTKLITFYIFYFKIKYCGWQVISFAGKYSNVVIKYIHVCTITPHFQHTRNNDLKKNSVALVRKRTIPTERPPPVGEVSVTWSAQRIPTAVNLCFWTGAATFYSSSSSIDLMRLSGPRSRPTTTQKIW